MKKTTTVKKKALAVWSVIFAIMFVFVTVATLIATNVPFLYNTINSTALGGETRYLKSGDPAEYMYYKSDYKNKKEVYEAANKLNERICEEGSVLLKNNANALPLAKGSRVTVFGKNSVNPVLGGSGSSAGTGASASSNLYSSLESVGIAYNPTVKSYYESKDSGSGRPTSPNMGSNLTGFPTAESALPYPNNIAASYASDYNDAALIVLSRIGGEGYDLPRQMFWDGSQYTKWSGTQTIPGARSKDDHYLQLDANEEAMIKEACSGKFDKVIVIINSSSTLELGFMNEQSTYNVLKDYSIDASKIDAALWIGHPGESGLAALGKLLTGEVNPSGRTVDTYVTDFKADPTWHNFGTQLEENGHRYFKQGGSTANAWFVEYREGIYSGYRYWETRGYTEAQKGNTDWYKNNVVYPMGYGLSYTDFEWSVKSVSVDEGSMLAKDGKLDITVEVSNIGERSGKDVVQLYYTAPYIDGGIEKAYKVLGDFVKTPELKAGEKTEVTLSIDVRDMASYDYSDANKNGFKGYEVEAGEYTLSVSHNAHDVEQALTFAVPDGGFTYDKDSATNNPVSNLFDDVSSHVQNYLSRKDNFANFDVLKGATDKEYRTLSPELLSQLTWKLNDKESDPWYSTEMPTQSETELTRKETTVRLYDLVGKGYNDELWDDLLDQLTVAQMTALIGSGNFRTLQIESIDKPLTIDADGPMGFAIFMGDDCVYDTCYYASECVLGSTWNVELAEELGKMVGNEGVVGNERDDGRTYSGWYAPACNIHRSQFGGRNFEYYSEDGLLSGKIAASVVKGAKSKGVYTYVKHFALNEQETNRDTTGLITWANEQSMREIYFVPFEWTVKDGKTSAMMSSFNRIGATWAGGHYNLLTKLLREEWGFEGMVITDFNLTTYMNADQMVRAGGDLNLSPGKNPTATTTATDVTAIRKAAKNILFTVANSNAMNGFGANVIWGYTLPLWVTLLIVIDCIMASMAILLFFVYLKSGKPVNGKKNIPVKAKKAKK